MSKQHAVNFLQRAIDTGDYHKVVSAEKNIPYGYSLDDALRSLGSESRRRYDAIKDRTGQFQQKIQNLQRDLKAQAQRNEQQISNMTSQFEKTIKKQGQEYDRRMNKMRKEITGELKVQKFQIEELSKEQKRQRQEYLQMGEKINQAIEEERKNRIKDFNHLQDQINSIHQTQEQKKKIAQDLLQGVDVLVNEIHGMPHQRFTSHRLDRIEKQINTVRDSLDTMPEGAWANLITAWNDLWDLKADITVKEVEFWEKYNQALQTSAHLLNEAAKNESRELEFPAEEGETQRETIDVDYWSFGQLEEHNKNIRSIESHIKENETNMDFGIDEVDEILARLEKEGPELGHIVIRAGNNVAASQIRFDMAEISGNVLLEQLFDEDTIKATYEGEDQRAGYVLQMENSNGTKATIVVSSPDQEDNPSQFKLSINFENDEGFLSPQQIEERSEKIEKLIQEDAGSIQAEKQGESICTDTPDLHFSDFNQVRQRKKEQMKTISSKLHRK